MEVTFTNLTENHKKISIAVTKDEFIRERKKSIKKYQKSAIVPGFRPGTAPESLILKMYGNSLGIDEIYEKAYGAFQEEVSKQQIKTILEPVAEFGPDADFTTGENITIDFEIGVEPELFFDPAQVSSEVLYKVELTDKELDEEIQSLLSQNKNVIQVENESEAHAFEFIIHSEGHEQQHTHRDEVEYIGKEDIREDKFDEFIQAFKSQNYDVNLEEFLVDVQAPKIQKILQSLHFHFGRMVTFTEITLEELPAKIYRGKNFENINDFKSLLKSEIESEYNAYNENVFVDKVIKNLLEKVESLPLEFIGKWWESREKGKNQAPFDDIKPYLISELSMNIVHKKLADALEIKVTREDVVQYFSTIYGKTFPEDQKEVMTPVIQSFIESELSDKNKAQKMFEKTYEETLKRKLIELKTNPYKITLTQMKEILSNTNH